MQADDNNGNNNAGDGVASTTPTTPATSNRDSLLSQIPGFRFDVPGTYTVPRSLLHQDDYFQPRKSFDNEFLATLETSIKEQGQDNPIPVFLNPDPESMEPLTLVGGNQRLHALRKLDVDNVKIFFDPKITAKTARRRAFRDNVSSPLPILDQIKVVKTEMTEWLGSPANNKEAPLQSQIKKAAAAISAGLSKKSTWIVNRFMLSLLSPDLQSRLALNQADPRYLPINVGLALSDLCHEEQDTVGTSVIGKTIDKSLRIVDEYKKNRRKGIQSPGDSPRPRVTAEKSAKTAAAQSISHPTAVEKASKLLQEALGLIVTAKQLAVAGIRFDELTNAQWNRLGSPLAGLMEDILYLKRGVFGDTKGVNREKYLLMAAAAHTLKQGLTGGLAEEMHEAVKDSVSNSGDVAHRFGT